MRQLLVECSDPGIIVSLAEEFENILRHASRTSRAQQLQRELNNLAQELGTEIEQAWHGFRIEVPNDSGRPLSFGNREIVDEARVQQLIAQAAERGIGKFEMRDRCLHWHGYSNLLRGETFERSLWHRVRRLYASSLRFSTVGVLRS